MCTMTTRTIFKKELHMSDPVVSRKVDEAPVGEQYTAGFYVDQEHRTIYFKLC